MAADLSIGARVRIISRGSLRRAVMLLCAVAQCLGGFAWAIDRDRTIEQLHHTTWTVRESAPTDVLMMAQTEDGFLWFATGSGLIRFDGVQFERYTPAAGQELPSRSIRSVYALPGNALIVGWTFGGAALVRDGRVTNYTTNEGYPTGTTYFFLTDGDGVLWAATADALARFDGTRWHVVGADWSFTGKRAYALFLDRNGTMGAFTESTLLLLPKGSKSFQATGGKTTTRTPIVKSPDGALFMSDPRGIRSIASLERYDDNDRPVNAAVGPAPETREMIADRDGSLWFTDRRGVGRITHPERPDAAAEFFTGDGLANPRAGRLFEDREGNVWIATPRGLERFRQGPFVQPTGPFLVNTGVLAPDSNGGIFVIETNKVLNHVAADGTTRELGQMKPESAYRDPNGVVWWGVQRLTTPVAELARYQDNRMETVPLPSDVPENAVVQSMTMDKSGSLWVSIIRSGVVRLSNGTWTRPAELPKAGKQTAVVLAADSKGRVWLSWGPEVSLWDQGKLRTFNAKDGLDIGFVFVIHEKGTHLWVAGERGLAVFESDRFRQLTIDDSSALRGIKGLVETDEGDLWLQGAAGVIRVKSNEVRRALADTRHVMIHRLFSYDDGLVGDPPDLRPLPSVTATTDGRLWFQTNRGVFMHDPRRRAENNVPPIVVVKSVAAGNARHLPSERIDLPALTTSLQIDYTATNMAVPSRIRFRNRLEGVDPDWQDAGTRRQAFYTNLHPGNYRFQVIAANEDGVWNTTGASVNFVIAPAWYQTTWFKALCALVALAAVALLLHLRVRQMQSQIHARLQERLNERERIARELHDTLLQGFQGLVLTFAATIRRIAPGEPREALERALMKAQETLELGRDRVRDLRNSVGFQGDLPAALKDAAADLAIAHPAAFELSERGTRRDLHPVGAEEVFLIAREALANAYHHAAATRIEAEIEYSDSQVRVRIRDDGKGVPTEIIEHGVPGHWGMTGMRERAQKLGARFALRTGAGSGTEVELDVPAEVAYVR